MVTILLYGELKRRFGRRFLLDVRSPAEAIRALSIQLPGFRQYFVNHAESLFKVIGTVRKNQYEYGEDDLNSPQSKGVLKIVPIVSGAGAVGRVIAGVVLIIVGAVLSYFGGVGSPLIMMGISLLAGGVAEMLTKRPKPQSQEKPDNQPSYTFNGAINTMGQGGPVPVGYGRLMIGSQVISVGFSSNNEIVV